MSTRGARDRPPPVLAAPRPDGAEHEHHTEVAGQRSGPDVRTYRFDSCAARAYQVALWQRIG